MRIDTLIKAVEQSDLPLIEKQEVTQILDWVHRFAVTFDDVGKEKRT